MSVKKKLTFNLDAEETKKGSAPPSAKVENEKEEEKEQIPPVVETETRPETPSVTGTARVGTPTDDGASKAFSYFSVMDAVTQNKTQPVKRASGKGLFKQVGKKFASQATVDKYDGEDLVITDQRPKDAAQIGHVWTEVKTRSLKIYKSLERAFRQVDTSNDGSISFLEFNGLLKKLGVILHGRFCRIIFDKASGGDKSMSYDEFVNTLMSESLAKVKEALKVMEKHRRKIRAMVQEFIRRLIFRSSTNQLKACDRFQLKITLPTLQLLWSDAAKIIGRSKDTMFNLEGCLRLNKVRDALFLNFEDEFFTIIFDKIDQQKIGKVSITDYFTAITLFGFITKMDMLRFIFSINDVDNDDSLTFPQLLHMFCSIRIQVPIATQDEEVYQANSLFNNELALQEGRRIFEVVIDNLDMARSTELPRTLVTYSELEVILLKFPFLLDSLFPGTYSLRWILPYLEYNNKVPQEDLQEDSICEVEQKDDASSPGRATPMTRIPSTPTIPSTFSRTPSIRTLHTYPSLDSLENRKEVSTRFLAAMREDPNNHSGFDFSLEQNATIPWRDLHANTLDEWYESNMQGPGQEVVDEIIDEESEDDFDEQFDDDPNKPAGTPPEGAIRPSKIIKLPNATGSSFTKKITSSSFRGTGLTTSQSAPTLHRKSLSTGQLTTTQSTTQLKRVAAKPKKKLTAEEKKRKESRKERNIVNELRKSGFFDAPLPDINIHRWGKEALGRFEHYSTAKGRAKNTSHIKRENISFRCALCCEEEKHDEIEIYRKHLADSRTGSMAHQQKTGNVRNVIMNTGYICRCTNIPEFA